MSLHSKGWLGVAKIFPNDWKALQVTGATAREIDTLAQLATGLSVDYAIYHSVHWTSLHQQQAFYGEIDFVIVNLAGR